MVSDKELNKSVSSVEKGEIVGYYEQDDSYIENISIKVNSSRNTTNIEYVDFRSFRDVDEMSYNAKIISSKIKEGKLRLKYRVSGNYKIECMIWKLN